MRKLIACAFMYSLDGLLADEGTEYWQFCFGLPLDPADLTTRRRWDVYQHLPLCRRSCPLVVPNQHPRWNGSGRPWRPR